MLLYGRHFLFLALIVAVLAACVAAVDLPRAAAGGFVAFGLYGALYSALTALTTWNRVPVWHRVGVVLLGSALSMLNVGASRGAAPLVAAWVGPAGPAVVLTAAAALGAAAFAMVLRWLLRLPLTLAATVALAAGCALGSFAVFRSGLYLLAPGPWFAATWWLTFSAGLGINDALRWFWNAIEPVRSDP
jgi:hypothetical protein